MPNLAAVVEALLPPVVEIRHDLHRHPELGYQERRTSAKVQDRLSELGVQHVGGLAGGTGVLGWIPATRPGGSCIALRADMDALPIHEETGRPYASQTPGIMHACGHDGHTAILLGTADALLRHEDRPNDVLLVFQPAEEGGAGGEAMCRDGVLRGAVMGRPADRMYGLHGIPDLPVNCVGTRVGPLMAAATSLTIRIRGRGGHAAYPHLGVDPIVVLAQMITALQTVASRTVDPLDAVVVTIGKVEAGFAHNVIPNEATLLGTLRTLREETWKKAKRRIEEIVRGTAQAMGAEAEVEWTGHYPAVVNDKDATRRFFERAREHLGKGRVYEIEEPSMGGEDFAFYGREVPACFFFLGLLPYGEETSPGLHTPTFDFNDDALRVGIETMTDLALRG